MAEGKWISGLTPEMPADEAARVVLSLRLSAVRHYLPLAAERAAEDIEYVHQLRVATRRAGAAVRIFRDLLPKKATRETKRILRALRRSAGAARDWDVFLARLARSSGPAADFLTGYALRLRLAAQDTLGVVAAEMAAALQEGCAAIPIAVRSPSNPEPTQTVRQHAATVLGELFARFTAEVEANPTAAEELHQLRITAKQLRYAMEVFAFCYTPPFRDALYPAIEQAQEVLGGVQDAVVASERLGQIEGELRYLPAVMADRLRPEIIALTEDERSQASRGEPEIREWADRWRRLTAEHSLAELMKPITV